YLRNDIVHEDHKGVSDWISKHNRYAELEARELLRGPHKRDQLRARLFGTQPERKRWLRNKIWNHLPPMLRPIVYFTYRYVLSGGFLDGREGFTYHFLQGLWFPMLIDIKMLEMHYQASSGVSASSK